MIKKLQSLKGLPSETKLSYRTFTPEGRAAHREGTVVEFTMTDGAKWIGNFVSDGEGLSPTPPPILLGQGVALVFHDRWCFVVKNETSARKI